MWGSCRIGGLVVEWAEPVVVAVAAVRVVPAFDPLEHRGCELVTRVPVVLVEELALEPGEERLRDAVVEAVTDGAHRSEQAGIADAVAEQPRVVLSAVVAVSITWPFGGWRFQVAIWIASATSSARM